MNSKKKISINLLQIPVNFPYFGEGKQEVYGAEEEKKKQNKDYKDEK